MNEYKFLKASEVQVGDVLRIGSLDEEVLDLEIEQIIEREFEIELFFKYFNLSAKYGFNDFVLFSRPVDLDPVVCGPWKMRPAKKLKVGDIIQDPFDPRTSDEFTEEVTICAINKRYSDGHSRESIVKVAVTYKSPSGFRTVDAAYGRDELVWRKRPKKVQPEPVEEEANPWTEQTDPPTEFEMEIDPDLWKMLNDVIFSKEDPSELIEKLRDAGRAKARESVDRIKALRDKVL